jgi:hypothetical protein
MLRITKPAKQRDSRARRLILGPVGLFAFWGSTQVIVMTVIVGFGRGWRLAM